MFNIAQYLDKFKTLGQGERILKQTIQLTLKETLNLEIDIQSITIKNGEILFKVSPAIKNLLFIKKQLLLDKIQEKTTAIILNLR